jgi:cytochrome c553
MRQWLIGIMVALLSFQMNAIALPALCGHVGCSAETLGQRSDEPQAVCAACTHCHAQPVTAIAPSLPTPFCDIRTAWTSGAEGFHAGPIAARPERPRW